MKAFSSECQPRTSSQPHGSAPCQKRQRTSPRENLQPRRSYASVAQDGRHENLNWPECKHGNTVPTPYQIFNQTKGAPYSKRRFYELVKLYHPDCKNKHCDEHGHPITHAMMVERYRLVVIANSILCDPVKRSMYDRYGAGWNGQPEVRGAEESSVARRRWDSDQSPSQNATWEDWERWYQRDARGAQGPYYFSNSAFVSLIVVFAALGGIGQATRAGNYSMSFLEERDKLHSDMSRDLMRRRNETVSASGNKDERVQSFLKTRDPVGYGVIDPWEDAYRRVLPELEVCSSGDIEKRDMDVYHPKDGPDRTPPQ